ncbi:hypothetical protein ACQ4PT_063363 [Festuca glaucescens]
MVPPPGATTRYTTSATPSPTPATSARAAVRRGSPNGQPPYGDTYFGRPTGRRSDGRVFIDFLAEFFGLPLLPPSKANGTDFKKGANMAIIGATTMNLDFFQSRGLGSRIWNNGALDAQIQWFQQLIPSIWGSASDCKSYLNDSLFILGEFGGNDYNAPIFGGRGIDEAISYVPQIIDKITGSVESDYDGDGCLKGFNDLSIYHNQLLREGIYNLQSKHTGVRLMYGDFYSQVTEMVRSPVSFGKYMLDHAIASTPHNEPIFVALARIVRIPVSN